MLVQLQFKLKVNISLFLCIALTAISLQAQDQTFANTVTFESNVLNSNNATADNGEFATLNSFAGAIMGAGSFTGELELQFPTTVSANTTTYIQIDFEDDILNVLLGGTLGTLLADAAGNIVLGDHFFNVEARMNATTVLSGTSQTGATDDRFRVVTNDIGQFFIALTPDVDYNRVYIEDVTNTELLGQNYSMNVHSAFFFGEVTCGIDPLFTDFDGDGLSVDVLEVGDAGVENLQFAIDENTTNFSELNLGIASANGAIRQNIYLGTVYSPSAEFAVTLKTDPSLVLLGIVNNVIITAFNGNDEVFSTTLSDGLTIDALGLLTDGEIIDVVFAPGLSFDQVTVELNSLQPINVSQSLDFFGITVTETPAPDVPNNQTFCALDNPTVADLETNGNTTILWYNAPNGGTAYNSTDVLINGQTYYASQVIDGCESKIRTAVLVTVNTTPPPTTTLPTQEFCIQDNPTIADLVVNEQNVIWYDMATGGTLLDSSTSLQDNQTYYASQIINGCESTTRLAILVRVHNTPPPTTINETQEFCEQDNPTIADIDVDGTAILWYSMPTGGTVITSDTALENGSTYYASQTLNGCESTSRLAVNVIIYNTPPPTTTNETQEFCIQENPIIADIQVNESPVTWFDAPTGGTAFSNNASLVNGQTYYASQTLNGCESTSRLAVTITIYNTPPPTGNTSQNFCIQDNPIIADIIVNEMNVTWYDAPTGGTPYQTTDALENGLTYYASQTLNNCESTSRLAVTIAIQNTPPPTTTDSSPEFCLADNPTLANLMVDGNNVIWYTAASNGNVLSLDTPLENNTTYYASQTLNNCESVQRLAVSPIIFDTPPPTTRDDTQTFCAIDNPTIANIQVNESPVTWYSMPTGGIILSSNTSLEHNETYYASQTINGCESTTRLAVTVDVQESMNPTITSESDSPVCLGLPIRYFTEEGQSNYMWEFTGGILIDGGGLDDNFISIEWDRLDNTSVSVSYDADNMCGNNSPATLNEVVEVCGDLSITKTVNNSTPSIGENVVFKITVSQTGPNDFFDITIDESLPSAYNLVSFETTQGTYNASTGEWFIDMLSVNQTATLTLTAEVLGNGDYLNIATITNSTPIDSDSSNNTAQAETDPICIFVFNEFSPNRDGTNDFFVISCIERFPNNELQIFNRYGSLIYKKRGYKNEWDGTANVSGVSNKGDVLPSDTYYYVLTVNDISRSLSGWVFLIK